MTVILAGCGGGYDIFGCIPLFYSLTKVDKILTNLSFTSTEVLDNLAGLNHVTKLLKGLYLIPPGTYAEECYYFPEYELANKLNHDIYIIHNSITIQEMISCYEYLIKYRSPGIEKVYLIDGGCDLLLSGNETELATPVEDMMHLKAIDTLPIKEKYVCAIGLNVDCGDGVIEAELVQRLKYLEDQGIIIEREIWSLDDSNVQKYYQITKSCNLKNTVVHSYIICALNDQYGLITPKHLIHKIKNTTVNVGTLTKTFVKLDLDKLVRIISYFDDLDITMDFEQIDQVIENYVKNRAITCKLDP